MSVDAQVGASNERHGRRGARAHGVGALLGVLVIGCCGGRETLAPSDGSKEQRAVIDMNSPATETDPLAKELADGRYGDFWNYDVRDETIERIWELPESFARLTAIVRDERGDAKARLLACEVLFERDMAFIREVGSATIARIYADALVNDRTGMANSWGLLWEHNDTGPVGQRFIELGMESLPVLTPLLDDVRAPLEYQGSEEATVGNAYGFRIKDFAAFYAGIVNRTPIAFHRDVVERDKAIEQLKAWIAMGDAAPRTPSYIKPL
jgi:hypothetical protein